MSRKFCYTERDEQCTMVHWQYLGLHCLLSFNSLSYQVHSMNAIAELVHHVAT